MTGAEDGVTRLQAVQGHGSGLGKTCWVIERIFTWLHHLEGLRTRYEIRADLRSHRRRVGQEAAA